jgi:uncharacterized membrane protein
VASTRRDPSIDVLRGLCVASMVVKHTAIYSMLYKVTHAALWIDGATASCCSPVWSSAWCRRGQRPPGTG